MPRRASSRTRQSHNIPEDACMVDSRRVPSTTSWTRCWRAPRGRLNPGLCTQSLWSTPQFQLQVYTNNAGTRADSANLEHRPPLKDPESGAQQRLAAGMIRDSQGRRHHSKHGRALFAQAWQSRSREPVRLGLSLRLEDLHTVIQPQSTAAICRSLHPKDLRSACRLRHGK